MIDALWRPEGLRRGRDAEAIRRPWVLVLGNRVAHCGPTPPDGLPEAVPRYEGGWLAEPLADAHVHLFLGGAFSTDERGRIAALPKEEAVIRALGLLEEYRRRGIVAVRDGGDPWGVALQAAAVANEQPGRFAAVLPAGAPLFRRGAYGAFLGTGVGDLAEAFDKLERARIEGATHLKILATGLNSLEEQGSVAAGGFSASELAQVFERARSLGLPSMVHANGRLDALGGAPGPRTSLEHGFQLADEDLAALAVSRTPWVPTLGAWAELMHHPALDENQRRVVEATDRRHRIEVASGQRLGVSILAGSDAGTPGVEHGEGLWGELDRLSAAGLTPREALAAAYRARLLCEDWLGRALGGLEEGKPVGFLWLDADPGGDLSALRRPRSVCFGGSLTPMQGHAP